jgi:type IV fimbrial biogenesis protein FimT
MLRQVRLAGITLLEMMIGLVIVSSLLLVGTPSFTRWIQHMQVRAAAESVQTGLQLARSEAVRRNRPVEFRLKNADGQVEWEIGCDATSAACPAVIASRNRSEAGQNARVAAAMAAAGAGFDTALVAGAGLPASVLFNGMGLVTGGSANRIELSNAALNPSPRLTVIISHGGAIRLCDPEIARNRDPQGCG